MAVIIDNIDFNNGVNTTPFYRSNAGDRIDVSMFVRVASRVNSINNPLTLDPILTQITSPSQSWLEAGFRAGDAVLVQVRDSSNVIINSYYTSVQSVSNSVLDVTSQLGFYDFTLGQTIEYIVVQSTGSPQEIQKDELDILLNQTINNNTGTPASLIDGETTRIRITGISSSVLNIPINGVVLGNQSGQMLISGSVTRITPTDVLYRYRIDLSFVNTGMFDDGTWFFTASCIKAFISMEWARVPNEPYARQILTYNDNADTGYYDEPYNTGISDSTLLQGISDVSYCAPSTHTIVVDGPTADIQIGACYLPQDDTYFKNKLQSQLDLSMVIPSTDLVVGTYTSPLNPSGAGYEINVTNIAVVGSQTSIEFTIVPNALFEAFMETRDVSDRLFLFWVRCGNINHLAYSTNLICAPVPADPLVLFYSAEFLDHSLNLDQFSGEIEDRIFNTEDDLALYSEFRLMKGVTYDEFNVYVEAKNSVTEESFTLRAYSFSFAGVQISNDGRYLLNESIAVNSSLPSTSQKINAKLRLEPLLDNVTEYGVSIYAPVLLDWRYWLSQLNANVDFYPTQNRNWEQYDNIGDWGVQMRLELVADGISNNYDAPLTILDYDSEPNIISDIQLFIDSTAQNVDIITEGLLMRIVVTHELISGDWGANAWGMITAEPTEASPRKIISTAIPYDFDASNPFAPLDNIAMVVTYPAPNIARMECYFNPDLINTINGVKFTSKIKKICGDVSTKTTTSGDVKQTTTGIDKTTT